MECKVELKEKNPHDEVNIFSRLFLTWSFSLFRTGYNRGLTVEDLCKARHGDHSGRLGDRLEKAWEEEIEKCKEKKGRPSFSRAIIRTFWLEYMLCGFEAGVLLIILWPLLPYTLALFIEYFSGEKTPAAYRLAHVSNFLMNLLSIITALMWTHLALIHGCVGMRVRIASCSLIYRKILKLGRNSLIKTEAGQVINLMSNDVNRFDTAAVFLNYLWVTPIAVPVVSYLMWQHVAWATLAALVVILSQSIFVQVYLSNLQGVLRAKIAKRTDERVRVMSELVNGVQVLKMYAWEKPFEKLVDKLRKSEMKFITQTTMIKGFSTALMVFTERFILLVTIITFVMMGGHITAKISFSLVQYVNVLQLACNILFPFGLSFLAESKVSVKRIEDFLLLEELRATEVPHTHIDADLKEATGDSNVIERPKALILSNVFASWKSETDMYNLSNITLTVNPGEFIGVAGSVGSGKSSLLQLILGEIKVIKGIVAVEESRISYASQEPWLFVGTVRQNILFGQPYDHLRYKKVVSVCALECDFEQFPAGDKTLVGERGISLSGGQRARIGLARACYRQADIYLLDDPLSAVDTHVGKHLVTECVNGFLRHNTRIVVTHQLHQLKYADKVVIMHNGEIDCQGRFDEVSHSPLFTELMKEDEHSEEFPAKNALPRTISVKSHTSLGTGHDNGGPANVEEGHDSDEVMETGRVSGKVYTQYFRAGSSWLVLTTTVAFIILAQVVTSTSDFWLSHWMNIIETSKITKTYSPSKNNYKTSDYNVAEDFLNETFMKSNSTRGLANPSEILLNQSYFMYIWAIAILSCTVLTTVRSVLFMWICMCSSIKLHNQMFSNILAATMRFFETNPSGRILNRFSKDMGLVDEFLPRMYLECIQMLMVTTGILVMVTIVSPYMVITALVSGCVMFIWTIIYLNTAQSIKRLEGVTRSPVFSHVSATMAGLTTIRSCGAQNLLRNQFDDKQDVHTSAWYLTLVTNSAFSIWMSLICSTYIITVAYTFLLLDNDTTKSGNVGLAISQGLLLINIVQYGLKQATDVISQMTSVERVLQFTSLPQEKTDGLTPPANWPQQAKLVFKDLSLRYDRDADPVLKKLNIVIESGWKVGVVGRTGAGKSSLISALFRLAPTEGHIFIDDLDTGKIALKELRSKMSIIPQEPVLFSASLRYNLDPFEKYTDAELWEALDQVELKQSVTSLSETVESGGSNFSAGQRQLLCLARAALGRNKLLVLDEATANVDPTTDALIQKSIRRHFAECTVITVAHRLHTVADSDRVIVMEAGEIVEFGHPHELLRKNEGPFTRMVRQLGPASALALRLLAAQAYQHHIRYVDDDDEIDEP